MASQIFVSYSHQDSEFATKLTKDLEREGYDIWLDTMDIRTGSRWDDEIVRALNASQVFMVIVSKTSAASQNVKDEIGYAVDHNMQIVPLLIEPCDVPFRLRRVQYVDFTALRYREGIKAVLAILRAAMPDAVPSPKERKPMDPAPLTAEIMNLLMPSLVKMGESALEEVGRKLPDKLGKIWGAIADRFQRNPSAAGAANDLVKNANDTDNQEAFGIQLRKALKEDSEFALLLTDLFEQAKKDGVVAKNNSIAVGNLHFGGDFDGNLIIGNGNQIH